MYKLHIEVLIMLKSKHRMGKNNNYYFPINNKFKLFSYGIIASALLGVSLAASEKSVYANTSETSTTTKISTDTNYSFVKNNKKINSQEEKNNNHGKDNECEWTFNPSTKTLTIKGGILSSKPISQIINANEVHYIAFEQVIADYGLPLKVQLAYNSSGKFANLPNLEGFINIENVDASETSDLSSLFANDSKLTALDLSTWTTINNRDMNSMFKNDVSLTTVNMDNFRTDSVFDFSHMFEGASSLATLKLANWKTGNVKNMSYMFSGICAADLNDITKWQTYNVTNMSYMFKNSNINQLNLSFWDTGNIFEMANMFEGMGKNLNGFILSLGKHRLKSDAFTNIGNEKFIPVAGGNVAQPAGKPITVAELAKLYDQEDAKCPADTYVTQPISWTTGNIDLDDTVNDIHIPVNKNDINHGSSKSIPNTGSFPVAVNGEQPALANNKTVTPEVRVANSSSSEAQEAKEVVKTPFTLYYPAQVYDKNGQPVKGFKLKAGMIVETFGTKKINELEFYKLGENIYVNTQDVTGQKKKIKHNSYVYNKKGKRIRKLLVKKGKSVRVYGNPIKIKKKLYYVIDKNKYIKVNNIA